MSTDEATALPESGATDYWKHPAYCGLMAARDGLREACALGFNFYLAVSDIEQKLAEIGVPLTVLEAHDYDRERRDREWNALTPEQRVQRLRKTHQECIEEIDATIGRAA